MSQNTSGEEYRIYHLKRNPTLTHFSNKSIRGAQHAQERDLPGVLSTSSGPIRRNNNNINTSRDSEVAVTSATVSRAGSAAVAAQAAWRHEVSYHKESQRMQGGNKASLPTREPHSASSCCRADGGGARAGGSSSCSSNGRSPSPACGGGGASRRHIDCTASGPAADTPEKNEHVVRARRPADSLSGPGVAISAHVQDDYWPVKRQPQRICRATRQHVNLFAVEEEANTAAAAAAQELVFVHKLRPSVSGTHRNQSRSTSQQQQQHSTSADTQLYAEEDLANDSSTRRQTMTALFSLPAPSVPRVPAPSSSGEYYTSNGLYGSGSRYRVPGVVICGDGQRLGTDNVGVDAGQCNMGHKSVNPSTTPPAVASSCDGEREWIRGTSAEAAYRNRQRMLKGSGRLW